ncbi:hypothetical protein OWT80_01590 [Bacteroides fragilis]|nr:hypothetical protein [Bacteroides fragilis]
MENVSLWKKFDLEGNWIAFPWNDKREIIGVLIIDIFSFLFIYYYEGL